MLKYICLFIVSFFIYAVNAQNSPITSARHKTVFIYNFTKYFEWPTKPDEFRIGVLGNDEDLIKELEKLASVKTVGSLSIKIMKFANISDIIQTEILVVDYKKNPELKVLKINKGTLVVTENDPDLNNIMLAFITKENNKLGFALNEINIQKSELKMSEMLKELAVDFKISKDNIVNNEKVLKEYRSVFDKFSEALKNNSSEIKLSKQEAAEVMEKIDANKKTINEKEEKLSTQEKTLWRQESEIKIQQKNLSDQKTKIDEQLRSILTQEQKLKLQEQKLEITIKQNKAKEDELASLFKFIAVQNKIVDGQKKRVNKQKSILEDQQKAIDLQKKRLLTQLGQINSQKTILYLAAFLVLIIAIALFIAYKGNKNKQRANTLLSQQKLEIEHQRELVEEKQKEILDSINYAKRIQYSLLASDKLLSENLPEHFLFFKPKDVVSGDFYWGSKLSSDNFVLVTADSTGHGVPGSIMSMLNISCLNEAINADKLTQPSDILNSTRSKIIDHLSNDGSAEGGKDGMDCSLVSFDFKNRKLVYAAANNPVWIIRDKTFIALVADRMPVGKHDRDSTPFTKQEFELQSGDMVYTLTDGFPDQFGGPKGKKFKYKQLEELLISISHESMEQQKKKLNEVFENWKGNLEQVDDVCVIGVRV